VTPGYIFLVGGHPVRKHGAEVVNFLWHGRNFAVSLI
jgi:hypothetical protein